MEITLFSANNGECPYIHGQEWISYLFKTEKLQSELYEYLINYGFRRSGNYFYKNNCPDCSQCISLRVLVNLFQKSKSQRKVFNKNRDIEFNIEHLNIDQECYNLYQKYSKYKHNQKATEEDFLQFLGTSAVDTRMMKYFINQRLVGVGWIDILPDSISSVYFIYDPEFQNRSLGVFSIIKEIELCSKLKKNYLHLGFTIESCSAMKYKRNFKPHQILMDNDWITQ